MTLLRRKRRGSVALEAAMVLPVILVLFSAVSQVLITSQSRVHLEQAAYAAARAALVYKCPPRQTMIAKWAPIQLAQHECFSNPSNLDAIALDKATDAARWALVAAASTTGSAQGRGCNLPEVAVELLAGGDRIAGRDVAARNALCYVFEPGNVSVDLEWQRPSGLSFFSAKRVPIRATVTFRYPLSTPFRRFLINQGSAGKRGDGTYWRTGTASVTLL